MARKKKGAEDRREDILVETLRQIEAKGIDQVRAADISSSLGVSTGLIFYHFNNLPALITAAVQYATDRDMAIIAGLLTDTDDDALTRLRAVLREYGPTGSAFGWRLWVECWSASLRDPELRAAIARLDQGWRTVIAGLIEEGVADGTFACPDPASAAWRLTSLLDGLAVHHVVFDEEVTMAQIEDWLDLATRRELGLPGAR
ncbi:TetR/AcrR family transcriptional regulator [Mycolicibacterium brumae]|uniref:TetR family transcriptional regulator n=1 Tax=Mycolicibacterium brumae TaxID=85968 RepID=A0A2G5PFI8_9MYCO|nr:TetR family transcriptional regulator C-terminal domain-containing protein [Mycolicibacterium brumae]MCV7192623.1 TetR family transcriptional regulator C-terminal domain-containing protein [Mycolicibacterium brumae]PIB77066.1 TetR family transcriptional regulator [Mycolicibacterium brumae]RWA18385.1 hypothetical protein MBRU_04000 [Mycolicibacterium brumae DSM 44177]UWW10393.1 TetR family transcriptional regulator C-terminal domain-containing protein [Mycolicibacterium brumae]